MDGSDEFCTPASLQSIPALLPWCIYLQVQHADQLHPLGHAQVLCTFGIDLWTGQIDGKASLFTLGSDHRCVVHRAEILKLCT